MFPKVIGGPGREGMGAGALLLPARATYNFGLYL
jgi:hypothetical protein